MKEKHIDLSIFLSLILRHKPEVIKLTLDDQGYLNIEDLIDGINNNSKYFIDSKVLDTIIETDNKGRYSYNDDKTKVRANQGHSVPVDLSLEAVIPPPLLYHGTSDKAIDKIVKEGLSKQSRLYVHLTEDLSLAKQIGGRRKGASAILEIDSNQMFKDGIQFFKSKNNVWLTDKVKPKYIKIKN